MAEGLRKFVCERCGCTAWIERSKKNSGRHYCDECQNSPERIANQKEAYNQRARDKYREERHKSTMLGWSLAYDPWKTGQLPADVLRNALI